MSAQSIRVPSYIHHKATNTARVRIAGREHSLGRFDSPSSYAKYDRLIAEWKAAGCPSHPVEDEPVIAELILAYWRHLKARRPDARLDNERVALRTLRESNALTPVSEFGPRAFRSLLATMAGRGWCRGTVNHRASIVRAMLEWAVAEEMIDPSVWHGVKAVKLLRRGEHGAVDHPGVTPVDESIVEATLAELPAMVADMVRLQLLTGARPGEVCAMTAGEIDTAGEVWMYQPRRHKTAHHGKSRRVAVGPRAQGVLAPYLRTELDAPLFSPAESERRRRESMHAARVTPLACGNRPGTNKSASPKRPPSDRYTTSTYARAIRRACESAGVPVWSPNQLRHTRATEIRRDFGLEHAGAVLGHARVDTTEIYAERDFGMAMRVARETG